MMIGKEREGEQQGAEAVQKRKDGGAGFVEGCVFHLFFLAGMTPVPQRLCK